MSNAAAGSAMWREVYWAIIAAWITIETIKAVLGLLLAVGATFLWGKD